MRVNVIPTKNPCISTNAKSQVLSMLLRWTALNCSEKENNYSPDFCGSSRCMPISQPTAISVNTTDMPIIRFNKTEVAVRHLICSIEPQVPSMP